MTIQKFICIPGTLLEIVAGRTTIGILNALYLSLAIFCLIILSQLIFIFFGLTQNYFTYFQTTAALNGRLQNHQ